MEGVGHSSVLVTGGTGLGQVPGYFPTDSLEVFSFFLGCGVGPPR